MKTPLQIPLRLATSLALAFSLACCDKKDTPPPATPPPVKTTGAAPASSTSPATTSAIPATPKDPSLADQAASLGFAGKLPADTEFYFGSANLKSQIDALKKSAFWKEVSSFMDDKTPAPTAGDKSMAALQKLWGDDFFIAGPKGMTQSAAWMVDFNHVYNEINFHALMTGGVAGMEGGKDAKPTPMIYLQALMQNPRQIDQVGKLITQFELPALLIGFKVENPAALARQLLPDEAFKDMPKDKFTLSTLKTPDGSSFQVISTEGSKLMTDVQKKEMLANLPPIFDDHARQVAEKAMTDMQAKKMAVGWGAVGDYLVFACGKNLDHLNFAITPGASLLSKTEMARLAPHVQKNLLGIIYGDAGMLTAASDTQPFTPMLRGALGAMKENKTFGEMGAKLSQELEEFSTLETAVFKRENTTMTAALWWDRGLHLESYGGPRARAFQTGVPLKYAGFVDKPGVILGVNYQRNKAYELASRAWMEKLVGMIYTGAQELMKTGIAGPNGAQQLAMFEMMAMPTLMKMYQADKDLTDKALGDENAFIIDINGKMPALPGVPPETKGMKFPRIITISDVNNRAEIGASWLKMNEAITQISTIAGAMGGAGAPGEDGKPGASAPAPVLPDPISSEKNGLTSYFYGMPFFAGDLLPCASLNDKVFMLSTSKDCAESFAAELAKPSTSKVDGLIWRFDPAALIEYGVSLSKFAPEQKPDQQKEMKQVLKWAKPFRAMQGHVFEENKMPRTSFSWEISDLVSFD